MNSWIIVKSYETLLGVMRQGPQQTTEPPPWYAFRPDEGRSLKTPSFWAAVNYLKGDYPLVAEFVEHGPVTADEILSMNDKCCVFGVADPKRESVEANL